MESRNSGTPDSHTLQEAKTHLIHATKRIADFTNFDSLLNVAWLAQWDAAIKDSEKNDNDETYMDQMQGFTEAVKKETNNCLKALRDLKYYAAKAFEKQARYKAFGFTRMTLVAQSTPSFLVFMQVNHRLALMVQAELLAVGMGMPQINNLNNCAVELSIAELNQELHKRNRLIKTEERIENINAIWKFMSSASNAAEVIYANDSDIRGLFYLPESTPKKTPKTTPEP